MCHEPSGKIATVGACGVVASQVADGSAASTGALVFSKVSPSLDCASPMPPLAA